MEVFEGGKRRETRTKRKSDVEKTKVENEKLGGRGGKEKREWRGKKGKKRREESGAERQRESKDETGRSEPSPEILARGGVSSVCSSLVRSNRAEFTDLATCESKSAVRIEPSAFRFINDTPGVPFHHFPANSTEIRSTKRRAVSALQFFTVQCEKCRVTETIKADAYLRALGLI